jgi:ABC-2 type transport system permease protein
VNLVGAEVRRFWARRAVAVVLLVTTVLVGLLAASAVWSTRPASDEDLRDVQSQIEQTRESWEQEVERCEEAPEDYFGPGADAAQCQDLVPTPEQYLGRAQLDLGSERDGRGLGMVLLLVGAAIVLAATFSGADWSSGAIGTQLVFEPRRLRVWVAKALAVVVSVTLSAALLAGAFWAVLYAVARARGIDVPDAAVTDVLEQTARGLALVAGAGLGAHALTMLLRSTVGTLGVLFAYVVAGEIVVASLPFDKMSQWSLANNVQAWVSGSLEVYDESVCAGASGFDGGCNPFYELSGAHGAAYLGVLLLVVVLLSPPAFRRRDVT